MSGRTVVVTGASGYLAGEVVKQLIAKGYTVRGTVRNLNDNEKTQHLKTIFPGVQLFEADLLKPGSFDEVISGSDYVLHVASPFQLNIKNPEEELIKPAVEGTKNVLSSVSKSPTVKRVVVTSSVAAIMTEHVPSPDHVFSEADWNTTSNIQNNPYRLSKTLAERYVWQWAEQNRNVRVLTVLPSFVIGPPISSRIDATSIGTVKSFLDGSAKQSGVAPAAFGVIDVRDVARLHVTCMEHHFASGRYLVTSSQGVPRLDLATALKKDFSDWPIPDKQNGQISFIPKYSTNKAKRDLGFDLEFQPEKSMVDMAKKLVELGVVKKPQ